MLHLKYINIYIHIYIYGKYCCVFLTFSLYRMRIISQSCLGFNDKNCLLYNHKINTIYRISHTSWSLYKSNHCKSIFAYWKVKKKDGVQQNIFGISDCNVGWSSILEGVFLQGILHQQLKMRRLFLVYHGLLSPWIIIMILIKW